MVQLNVKQFFELVLQSKLVEEVKLKQAMTDYKQLHQGRLPQTPDELADEFIRLDLLTRWDCDKLLLAQLHLWQLLQRSELVEEAKLEQAMTDYKQSHQGKLPQTRDELTDELIRLDLLTEWQRNKLFKGKSRGFFLGRYKLLRHLGSGGMSSVYLARHDVMKKDVAIKVLPYHRVNDASYLDRFLLEAEATAALEHKNIVRVNYFDVKKGKQKEGKKDESAEPDTYYLVMEYVTGKDLQTIVKERGPLDFKVAAGYIAQAAEGLDYAHKEGVIHRDIKPANLLIDDNGAVKILDLGLARFSDDEKMASVTLTHNESILGTADYLAPEQAVNSHNVDSRVDIYGLGCTFYYLLTGRALFPEGSLAQRIAKQIREMPDDIRVSREDCPQELVAICNKMIQKNPDHRYQTCLEIGQVLQDWVQDKPVSVPLALVGSLAGKEISDAADDSNPGKERSEFISVSDVGDASTVNLDRRKELTAEDENRLAEIDPQAGRGTVKDPRISATVVGSEDGNRVPAEGSESPSSRVDLGIEVLDAGSHKSTRSQRLLENRRRSKNLLWWVVGAVSLAVVIGVMSVGLLLLLLSRSRDLGQEKERDTSAIERIDDDLIASHTWTQSLCSG